MAEKVYPTDNRIPHRVAHVVVSVELTDHVGTNLEMLGRDTRAPEHTVARVSEIRRVVVPTLNSDGIGPVLVELANSVAHQLMCRPDDTPEA